MTISLTTGNYLVVPKEYISEAVSWSGPGPEQGTARWDKGGCSWDSRTGPGLSQAPGLRAGRGLDQAAGQRGEGLTLLAAMNCWISPGVL